MRQPYLSKRSIKPLAMSTKRAIWAILEITINDISVVNITYILRKKFSLDEIVLLYQRDSSTLNHHR